MKPRSVGAFCPAHGPLTGKPDMRLGQPVFARFDHDRGNPEITDLVLSDSSQSRDVGFLAWLIWRVI